MCFYGEIKKNNSRIIVKYLVNSSETGWLYRTEYVSERPTVKERQRLRETESWTDRSCFIWQKNKCTRESTYIQTWSVLYDSRSVPGYFQHCICRSWHRHQPEDSVLSTDLHSEYIWNQRYVALSVYVLTRERICIYSRKLYSYIIVYSEHEICMYYIYSSMWPMFEGLNKSLWLKVYISHSVIRVQI